ncbi:hypothetical protein HC256_004227 [Beauveria bassiana]|nr:hypothetical protein HC256_004227 [Beauveria bassiana]
MRQVVDVYFQRLYLPHFVNDRSFKRLLHLSSQYMKDCQLRFLPCIYDSMPPLLRLPVVMSLKNVPFSSAVAFFRSVACRWLAAHPRLKSYPTWVPVETVRERLRELVEDLHTPELFLILDTDCDDSVEWKCFRADASFHGTIEDGII